MCARRTWLRAVMRVRVMAAVCACACAVPGTLALFNEGCISSSDGSCSIKACENCVSNVVRVWTVPGWAWIRAPCVH